MNDFELLDEESADEPRRPRWKGKLLALILLIAVITLVALWPRELLAMLAGLFIVVAVGWAYVKYKFLGNSDEEDDPVYVDQFDEEDAFEEIDPEELEALEQQLREAFLSQIGWSAVEWELNRERVVIIHDKMERWEAVESYIDALPEDQLEDEEKRAYRIAQSLSAREAFPIIQQHAPESCRFEKLLSLSEPAVAEVYRGPAVPDA